MSLDKRKYEVGATKLALPIDNCYLVKKKFDRFFLPCLFGDLILTNLLQFLLCRHHLWKRSRERNANYIYDIGFSRIHTLQEVRITKDKDIYQK